VKKNPHQIEVMEFSLYILTTEPLTVLYRAVCGAHGCGLDRLDNAEFDAIPHHATPLPSTARRWLFGVEATFVVIAIVLAAFLTGRNSTRPPGNSTRPPGGPSGSSEEVVPLTYWPGKPRRRWRKDTTVVQLGAGRLTKATARMMCDPHVQLLAPLVFYTGASLGFVLNDFTVVSHLSLRPLIHIHLLKLTERRLTLMLL